MRAFLIGLGFAIVLNVFNVSSVALKAQDKNVPRNSEKKERSQEAPKITEAEPMSFWMAKKLDYSKAILESLTKGDFEQLADDAEKMRLLGKIEGFVRRNNDNYRVQLRTFEFANQELVRQAERKNAEGAALAFNQLTTSCVACHILIRAGEE
jgi:hypothetical protein